MSIAVSAAEAGKYIGYFTVTEDNMSFKREGYSRQDILKMGDVVYFMYVRGQLMKIGKAGGATGFQGRANTYSQGRFGDATNRKILDYMKGLGESEIQVYAISVPREEVYRQCPITGREVKYSVSMHKEYEAFLTSQFLTEEPKNELPFCTQLK